MAMVVILMVRHRISEDGAKLKHIERVLSSLLYFEGPVADLDLADGGMSMHSLRSLNPWNGAPNIVVCPRNPVK